MYRRSIPLFLTAAISLSSGGIRADEQHLSPSTEEVVSESSPTTVEAHTPAPAEETLSSQPKEVGPASDAAAKAARSRKWQNIGIACFAVVAAAVGITLASTHGGHHAKQ